MKIATWNLQRPAITGPRVDRLLEQIRKANADIWILTETRDNIDLSADGYSAAASDPIEAMHHRGESRTTIWWRHPIALGKRIQTHCTATAVCVELESTPIGPMVVYGTIIPYGTAGGRYAYYSAGRERLGAKAWELHNESISLHQNDLVKLRNEFPNHGFCFAGDFNQSRDGRKWNGREYYGTKKGRNLLTECLHAAGLKCVTEDDFIALKKVTTQSIVDHICINLGWHDRVNEVGAWDAPQVDKRRCSDHCGVWISIDSKK